MPYRLLLLLLATTLPAAAQPATGGAGAARPQRPVAPDAVVAPRGYRAPHVLPDSVLMRIDGREDVTKRRFLRAVRLLGGNPDSLTPSSRDRFLELVLEQRVLAARAAKDPRPWGRSDSVQFRVERDNVLLRAALSDQFTRVEARRRALSQPDLDEQTMGVAARESLMVELHPVYDEELLKLVGSYFAELPEPTASMTAREQLALAAMVPKVPAEDTLKVLARSRLGEFRVADLLADWRRLSGAYRPRVTDNEGVRALVQNSLFERLIREAAADPALPRRSEVAAVLADRAEYHGVSAFLQREVVAKIPMDSVTLERWFSANRSRFDRPPRAVLVLLTLPDEKSADSLARRFTIPGEAESLAFRAQRAGVLYTHVSTATGDSALYAEALRTGVGGVSGPVKVDSGWRVYKVLSLDPVTPQEFTAVRGDVENAWYAAESERRIRALLDGLKRAARVERNEPALRALVLRRTASRR